MTKSTATLKLKQIANILGPGLLFASSAIGTSHLVLSTKAGAHHGMIFIWVILGALLLKYPFFEFGSRYANATGHSLLKAYRQQGTWVVLLFLLVVFINMFAVTGAIGAVSAGLLATMMGLGHIPMPILVGGVLGLTTLMLLIGRYPALDNFIKLISVVLLVTVFTAFFAVLFKGPLVPVEGFQPNANILEGAGLVLMISLIGWMPAGMEASTMTSIWTVEKMNSSHYRPTLKEALFDFNLGYIFTTVLALLFLTIGAFTVYGSGELLDGNATQFSNKLLKVFTSNLGQWSYWVIALAAFGTIYGTLITVMDAFTRSFIRGIQVLKFAQIENDDTQKRFLERNYNIFLPVIAVGGFLLFYFSAASMLKVLEMATITAFLTAPIIAVLNLRAIQSDAVPVTHRPSKLMLGLAYLGLVAMLAFSVYYLLDLFVYRGGIPTG